MYSRDLTPLPNIKEVILNSFVVVSEEVKSAASYALGCICIGNLHEYLPFILRESQEQPKRQYLLLHSVKEVRFPLFKVTKCNFKFQRYNKNVAILVKVFMTDLLIRISKIHLKNNIRIIILSLRRILQFSATLKADISNLVVITNQSSYFRKPFN